MPKQVYFSVWHTVPVLPSKLLNSHFPKKYALVVDVQELGTFNVRRSFVTGLTTNPFFQYDSLVSTFSHQHPIVWPYRVFGNCRPLLHFFYTLVTHFRIAKSIVDASLSDKIDSLEFSYTCFKIPSNPRQSGGKCFSINALNISMKGTSTYAVWLFHFFSNGKSFSFCKKVSFLTCLIIKLLYIVGKQFQILKCIESVCSNCKKRRKSKAGGSTFRVIFRSLDPRLLLTIEFSNFCVCNKASTTFIRGAKKFRSQ